MKYIYTHIKEFFKVSDWNEDVSANLTLPMNFLISAYIYLSTNYLIFQIQGPFGLQPPPGDWAEFKKRIAGQCSYTILRSGC